MLVIALIATAIALLVLGVDVPGERERR